MSIDQYKAAQDARSRALRTLAQGLLVDVAATVSVALVAVVSDIQWTQAYWIGVASLAAKTAITTGVSYAARKLVPPAV